ncbi:MAG: ABC transporter permease subunit [Firmicutes bacterium]|nr:ABC transporter permease subunit [Bacillota bacterium]
MNNTFSLYKTEIRKILSKKSVWIAMAVSIALVLAVGVINLSAYGRSADVKEQEELLTAISGSTIDDVFLDNFRNEMENKIDENPEFFDMLAAYDPGTVYQNAAGQIGKSALYDYLYDVTRDREKVAAITSDEFYKAMREDIIHDGRVLGSSEAELDTWLEIYDGIEKPMVYSYALAYRNILEVLYIIGWALILNISIALAGIFADEKTFRTDAMILSSKNGRLPVCLAKIAAGSTIAVSEAVILLGLCLGVMFLFYGTTGWNAMIQNVIPSSPWNTTAGTMTLIYFALAVLISILFAMTNALSSLLTKSAVVTMAIHAAAIFAGLFNIPGKAGIIKKYWQLRPTMVLYSGTFCNTFRYGNMNNVETSILGYCICIAIFVAALLTSYRKTQVESR